jgi:hypothetical protein
MHMMRLLPPGMAERCSPLLLDETWESWQRNLVILYGEEHLGPDAGLGFTREEFMRLTEQRRRLSRRVSTMTVTVGRSSPMHDADVIRMYGPLAGTFIRPRHCMGKIATTTGIQRRSHLFPTRHKPAAAEPSDFPCLVFCEKYCTSVCSAGRICGHSA